MSRDGSIRIDFAGGEYRFRLAIGELRELQEAVNKPRAKIGAPLIGPATLFEAVRSNNAWPHEIREIMRLGLIGGGTEPAEALDLVRRYVEERPLAENGIHATLVLAAALFGSEEEPIEGKPNPESGETTSSASPDSTDGAQS